MTTITETTIDPVTPPPAKKDKKAPFYVVLSAWAAPIMVATGWAFLAAIPVALLTFATWTNPKVRALRWWSTALAGIYAIPFSIYLWQDTYPSMSKMLDLPTTIAIVIPAVVIVAKLWRSHR